MVVTLTPPPAPATQTVVVQLPPEVVKHFAPPSDGLSQATATIIAALIAVVAAGIAFGGVIYQVRATARGQQKDRDDENRRQRWTERSQLLADAAAAATAIQDSFYRAIASPEDADNCNTFAGKYRDAELLGNRLKVVDLRNSAKALDVFLNTALDKFGSDRFSELSEMHDLLIETFSAELNEEPSKIPSANGRGETSSPDPTEPTNDTASMGRPTPADGAAKETPTRPEEHGED